MIDIHTHLLYGVDDGARTAEISLAVLERFAAEGVTIVVCTPHLNSSEVADAPFEDHRRRLAELNARAPQSLRLVPGWEIMLDMPGVPLPVDKFGLGGSSSMLVEFQRRGFPAPAAGELARLRDSGIVPVVAHPERYHGVDLDVVREWREMGGIMQVDSMMLTHPSPAGALSCALVEAGLVDCLASDNHGDSRSLADASAHLTELGGAEQALLMTRINPERLLANQPVLPVPPLRKRGRLWQRMRDMIGALRS